MDNHINIHTEGYGETAFDRAKLISWWSQEAVSSSKVLVVGAGAIGNETLKNLALMGVGSLFICDMDTISTSNLSRTVLFGKDDVGKFKAEVAAERVKQMNNNSASKVDFFVGDIIHKLGHGVFRRFDIVLGCLDNMYTRLDVNRRCNLFKKPYLDAGISELGLSLSVHHYPESSCLACGMSNADIKAERRIRYSCDEFKQRIFQEGHAATVLISTAIAGALQVQETIKAIHQIKGIDLDPPIQYGKKYYYQGMNHLFLQMPIAKKEDCMSNHICIDDEIIEAPISAKDTLGTVLDYLEDLLGYECVIDLYPDSKFVTTAMCTICGKKITFNKPNFDIYQEDIYCENCIKYRNENAGHTPDHEFIEIFGKDSDFLDYSLEELGVPLMHVLNVRKKDDQSVLKYVELTADLNAVLPNTFGC